MLKQGSKIVINMPESPIHNRKGIITFISSYVGLTLYEVMLDNNTISKYFLYGHELKVIETGRYKII